MDSGELEAAAVRAKHAYLSDCGVYQWLLKPRGSLKYLAFVLHLPGENMQVPKDRYSVFIAPSLYRILSAFESLFMPDLGFFTKP